MDKVIGSVLGGAFTLFASTAIAAHAKHGNDSPSANNGNTQPKSNLTPIGDKNFQILSFTNRAAENIQTWSKGDWSPGQNSSVLWYSRFSNRYDGWPSCQQKTWNFGNVTTERGTVKGMLDMIRLITKDDMSYYHIAGTNLLSDSEMNNIITNIFKKTGNWDKVGPAAGEQSCISSTINSWGIPVISSLLQSIINLVSGLVKKVFKTVANTTVNGTGTNGSDTFADADTIAEIASFVA